MLTKNLNPILKATLAAAMIAPAIFTIPATNVEAATEIQPSVQAPVALTAPPPEYHNIQSLAQLKYIYNAVGAVTPGGGLTAVVTTTTSTYQKMSSIKVDYRLERWTGTSWVTYRSDSDSATNVSVLNAKSSWTVITGYYYRVVSTHTVRDGSTTETTTHTSPSTLF